jgi:hypothetical protein
MMIISWLPDIADKVRARGREQTHSHSMVAGGLPLMS